MRVGERGWFGMLSNRFGREGKPSGGGSADPPMGQRGVRGFSFIELVMVLAVISVLAALAVPHVHRVKMTAQEKVALAGVRAIFVAEGLHHARFGSFGDLESLIAAEFVDDSFRSGEKSGYLFEISDPSSNDFQLRAVPVSFGDTGFKAYFTDGTGVIRYTDNGSTPGPGSPVWQ